MSKTIKVEHTVALDESRPLTCRAECESGGWYTLCQYLVRRDRTHGRKAPVERGLPKCSLFNEWLNQPEFYPMKCDACLIACGLKKGEQE